MIPMRDEHASLALRAFVACVGVCFLIETSANALYLFRAAGGAVNFLAATLSGAGGVAVAVIGATLAVRWTQVSWRSPNKYFLTLLVAGCVGFGYIAGLRLFGVTLADGGLRRERQAMQGKLADTELKRKQAERDAIGTPANADAIKAAIAKELGAFIGKAGKTVGQATRDCADPSWAPTACKRVGDHKVKLADAERAATLDGEITAAAKKLDGAPIVAGGDADLQVLASISGASVDDVKFWLPVGVVTLMTLLANFGLPLSGFLPHQQMPAPMAHQPPRLLARGQAVDIGGEPPHSGASVWSHGAPPSGPSYPGASVMPQGGPSSVAPHMSGSPISIVFGNPAAAGVAPANANDAGGAPAPTHEPARAPATLVRPPRHDLPAMPADVPPVDRSRLTAALGIGASEIADVALSFKAACIADAPGAVVAIGDLYRRYRSWVGERAVTEQAFGPLLQAIGLAIVDVGGVVHVRDVMMRAGAPTVAAVA